MLMEDLLTNDLSTIDRRSSKNFADARKTAEHREALYAIREKRALATTMSTTCRT